jgi:hypothetical protein
MKKGEFLIKYNTAKQVSEAAFSKLGLAAKKFTKAYQDEYADLSDEEHFLRKDFAIIEGEGVNKKAKTERLQNGAEILVMDDSKEKELFAALKAWRKEEISFELDKYEPIKLEGKLLFMSAPIYDTLNGYVFNVSEEAYLEALEAEIIRQQEESQTNK